MASVSMDSGSDNERFQDEDDFDVDNMDFDLPSAPVAVQPTASGSTSRSSGAGGPSISAQQQAMLNAFGNGSTSAAGSSSSSVYSNSAFGGGVPNNSRIVNAGDASKYKHYQTIYPIYIDRSRAHKNGERRISKNKAIRFPKAQEIAEVCGRFFGLAPVFEPEKTHPRDWENPGRVRVLLKDDNGKPVNPQVPDKYTLLIKLGEVIAMLRKQSGISSKIINRYPYQSPALSYGTYEEALKGGGQMQQMMQGMLGGAGGPTPEQEEENKKRETERELAEKQKIAKMKALQKQGRRMGRR